MTRPCAGPVQHRTTGELVCPHGAVPNEDAGETWTMLCDYCAADRERYDELVQDMRYEDG